MRSSHRATVIFVLALTAAACSSDDTEEVTRPGTGDPDGGAESDSAAPAADDAGGATEAPADDCDVVVDDADCDTSLRPIVFVHGTFGSATEISNTAMLFGSNGYCQDRFVAVEYNSIPGSIQSPVEMLDALIDQVLADTGFDQVDLAGHSQGTGHACSYLADPARAAKVAHYINISGMCAGNGVPTLSLSSENDIAGTPHHSSGDNVEQVTLQDEDHVALAGSKNAFVAMYRYLMGKDPEYTTVQCGQDPITIDGKAVTFGDNEPNPNGTIEVFEIDQLDDPRERNEPVQVIAADADGHFNAQIKRNVRYEFRALDPDGNLLGYLYYAPFKRSNYLMRFLSESKNPLVLGASTDQVVRSPNHVGMVARYIAGAFRKDWNNSLMIDGEEVLSDQNAPRSNSVVGFFMYDANENGASDLGAVFGPMSFLVGTDVFMDASEPRFMDIEWTNEEGASVALKVPNWPSSDNLVSLILPY